MHSTDSRSCCHDPLDPVLLLWCNYNATLLLIISVGHYCLIYFRRKMITIYSIINKYFDLIWNPLVLFYFFIVLHSFFHFIQTTLYLFIEELSAMTFLASYLTKTLYDFFNRVHIYRHRHSYSTVFYKILYVPHIK